MYDVIIIGAGPAGASLARLLDKNLKVMIIDKRNLGDETDFSREKCCGGLLAPAAQKALAKQGLGIPSSIMENPQTFSVRSVDIDNGLIRYYQRHYINISREKFDRWLVSLIPDSVDRNFGCIYRNYSEEADAYTVVVEKNGIANEIKTKVLIGADGALSRVRAQTFENKATPEKYISIQEHYSAGKILPCYVSVFDSKVTDFYSWIIQKNDEFLVGTAVHEASDAEKKFNKLIDKMKKLGYISGEPLRRTGTMIMRPLKLGQLCIRNNNIALAGEAAGLISPSSAEGISYALESGSILAEAINLNPQKFGKHYEKGLRGLKLNLVYKKLKVKLMYNKFTRGLIMKSGFMSMDVDGGPEF
jgi:flavin-dependent dehydrogenase